MLSWGCWPAFSLLSPSSLIPLSTRREWIWEGKRSFDAAQVDEVDIIQSDNGLLCIYISILSLSLSLNINVPPRSLEVNTGPAPFCAFRSGGRQLTSSTCDDSYASTASSLFFSTYIFSPSHKIWCTSWSRRTRCYTSHRQMVVTLTEACHTLTKSRLLCLM